MLGKPVEFIWHESDDLHGLRRCYLPGGFSYGDYLRTGALARFSPVMKAVEKFARQWRTCFRDLQRISDSSGSGPAARSDVAKLWPAIYLPPGHIRVETNETPFTCAAKVGDVIEAPDRARDGNYFCDAATLAELEK